ncbi:MAG: DUF3108 domain-containing protein [Candidatus Omnitrophota bacterium]|nr:DUF3108 domain-containing protein [Candidatus Omnitrophota bacterium]MBU2528639.1 DUF3108 domain-containing protein [bacterium]MBU3930087.1 DUF3108 domain-containing protein [bacterium]MBU4123520.1 DUF3108 domain-containing protein [bacterium]
MKHLRWLFILFLLFVSPRMGETIPLGVDLSALPFGEKEELVYNVRWSFINVGEAVLGLNRISGSVWRVYSTAKSYSFFDSFYKVRDSIESLWDIGLGRSLRFEKRTREGGKEKDELIVISAATNTAVKDGRKWKVSPRALDVLSALHFIRMQPLSVGKNIVMDVYTKNKLWPLEVAVIKKERIKVGDKKYSTILVEPKMREEGIFNAKGRIWVWLTDDENRVPVRMNSKVLIGSVSVDLIEIRR